MEFNVLWYSGFQIQLLTFIPARIRIFNLAELTTQFQTSFTAPHPTGTDITFTLL
jgi:hypothetical protein